MGHDHWNPKEKYLLSRERIDELVILLKSINDDDHQNALELLEDILDEMKKS
jgi:hypothetical protein